MPSIESLLEILPTAAGIIVVVILLVGVHLWLSRRTDATIRSFRNQVVMIVLTAVAGIAIVLMLPIGSASRGQLLSFFGILISAAIALSSTTFLGNALAGLLLQSVKGFRIGDFIRVGDHFGRVTERGLFHTEIQTENRTLTTLSNLYLVTEPVTAIRSSGTIVAASVTLGYDIPRRQVENLLLEAARAAGLTEPYVQILDLGDFSVEYRIAGLLEDVKQLIRTRSELRARMLDSLHGGGVEIVSPSFMNQRALDPERPVIPDGESAAVAPEPPATAPEEIIFDKAEEAEADAALELELGRLVQEIDGLKGQLKGTPEDVRGSLQSEIDQLEARRSELETQIAQAKAKAKAREDD